MNPVLSLPGRPAVFLLWFAVIAAVLLQGWNWLAAPYASALIWLVNLGSAQLPASLQLTGTATHGAMGSAFVAAVALFMATPVRDFAWKCRWSATVAVVLFLLHAALLTVQVRFAWATMESMRQAPRAYLSGMAQMPDGMASADIASAWYWLFPMCTALIWFAAMQRAQAE